jgi:hypothetical protein
MTVVAGASPKHGTKHRTIAEQFSGLAALAKEGRNRGDDARVRRW